MRNREQVKHTEFGGDLQADQVAVIVQRHALASVTNRHREHALVHLGVVDKHARDGVLAHHRAVELELDLLAIKGEVGVGADQAGLVGAGIQAVEVHPGHRQAGGAARLEHRHNEVHLVNGKTNRVLIRRTGHQTAVCGLAQGFVRTVKADKGLHVNTRHHQRIGRSDNFHARQVEANAAQGLFLERKAALQRHDTGHLCGGQTNRSFNQRRVEVQHDGITTGVDTETCTRSVVGEIDHRAIFGTLVQGHGGIAQAELDEVIKTDKTDHAGIGLERGVLGLGELVLKQAQTKAEVVNHQPDGIGVGNGVGLNRIALGIRGNNGCYLPVVVGVSAVRTTHTHKRLCMAGANGEGLGQHGRAQAQRVFGGECLRGTFLEGKRARDINKLGNLERGVVQAGTDGAPGHVEHDGVGRIAGGQRVTADTVGNTTAN